MVRSPVTWYMLSASDASPFQLNNCIEISITIKIQRETWDMSCVNFHSHESSNIWHYHSQAIAVAHVVGYILKSTSSFKEKKLIDFLSLHWKKWTLQKFIIIDAWNGLKHYPNKTLDAKPSVVVHETISWISFIILGHKNELALIFGPR